MIDQEKMGKYIAEKRKLYGLTQKQLADAVGLTDKAVSKWERGKSIPDNGVLPDICEALHISVNELLAGEDIKPEEFVNKAEQNIILLIEDQKKQEKGTKRIISGICFAAGVVAAMIALISGVSALTYNLSGPVKIAAFLDLPSFLFVVGVSVIVSLLSGTFADFCRGMGENLRKIIRQKTRDSRIVSKAKTDQMESLDNTESIDSIGNIGSAESIESAEGTESKGSAESEENTGRFAAAVEVIMAANLCGGILCGLGQLIIIFSQADGRTDYFPAIISLSLLPLFYAVFLDLILLPVLFRK